MHFQTRHVLIGAGIGLLTAVALGRKYLMSKLQLAKIEGDAADRYGFPRWWFVTLGLQETRLDPNAINMTGGDKLRGGSWGINQISLQTAREHGFTGEAKKLLDPIVNAEWTGRILSNPLDRWGNRRGPPRTFVEAASMWNGGFYPGDQPPPGGKPLKDITRAQVAEYVKSASAFSDVAERMV